MSESQAFFRFYAELNDLLPSRKRKELEHEFSFFGKNTVKDAIESFNIPHTQVDLIVVNQVSVGFDYLLNPGDRVSVYPVFETLDISPVTRLRPKPLRHPAFILDVHLGKLARLMRMAGFDTLYRINSHSWFIISTSPTITIETACKRCIIPHTEAEFFHYKDKKPFFDVGLDNKNYYCIAYAADKQYTV